MVQANCIMVESGPHPAHHSVQLFSALLPSDPLARRHGLQAWEGTNLSRYIPLLMFLLVDFLSNPGSRSTTDITNLLLLLFLPKGFGT